MRDFHQLKVWEKAHNLALTTHQLTSSFPKQELFGLTSQLRRASLSIPTNIAEGCGRHTDANFARFLQIGMGSACETEHLLLFAYELGYIQVDEYLRVQQSTEEVKRMLTSLLKKVRRKPPTDQ